MTSGNEVVAGSTGKITRIKEIRQDKSMEMKRVLLKLSGEALAGPKKTGFDEATVLAVAKQIHRQFLMREYRSAL